ncbi:unnamed protein product [Cunninghamella blakesleeana]
MGRDPDVKEIPYLWIDAISVNQQNHFKKKEAIFKMNQIYEMASYILAVPDLHYEDIKKNTANKEIMDLIYKYNYIIHNEIYNHSAINNKKNTIKSTSNPTQHSNNYHSSITQKLIQKNRIHENDEVIKEMDEVIKENEELKKEKKEDELRKAYQFLAYLLHDWSNRTWVISEYQMAREKYIKYGTPLKYIFISLLWKENYFLIYKPFFSYNFNDQYSRESKMVYKEPHLSYNEVDDISKFNRFLKTKFIQHSYINMMVGSYASRNEDRFFAILPLWKKYNHLVKDIANWNITNMTSVKLKLYEILSDDGDKDDKDDENDEDDEDHVGNLWEMARLLYKSFIYIGKPILPSFATSHHPHANIGELDNTTFVCNQVIDYYSEWDDDEIKEFIEDYYIMEERSIFKQNLISIQFNKEYCYLSIKANEYVLFNASSYTFSQKELSKYSLVEDDLKIIYIPYFTYDVYKYCNSFPIDRSYPLLSGVHLIGNMKMNRWILHQLFRRERHEQYTFCCSNDYTFNVY